MRAAARSRAAKASAARRTCPRCERAGALVEVPRRYSRPPHAYCRYAAEGLCDHDAAAAELAAGLRIVADGLHRVGVLACFTADGKLLSSTFITELDDAGLIALPAEGQLGAVLLTPAGARRLTELTRRNRG